MEIKYRTQFGELLGHFCLSGHGVELGVAEGANAKHIISWPAITKLYLIDAWQQLQQKGDGHNPQSWHDFNREMALLNTEEFKEKRVILQGMSIEMIKEIPDDSLIYAYVDGDHSLQGCYNDLQAIWPKIKVGGILSGHDYLALHYGVNDAVRHFLFDLKNYTLEEIHVTEEDGDNNMVSFWLVKK